MLRSVTFIFCIFFFKPTTSQKNYQQKLNNYPLNCTINSRRIFFERIVSCILKRFLRRKKITAKNLRAINDYWFYLRNEQNDFQLLWRCCTTSVNMLFVFASAAQIQKNPVHHHFYPCRRSYNYWFNYMGSERLKLQRSTLLHYII